MRTLPMAELHLLTTSPHVEEVPAGAAIVLHAALFIRCMLCCIQQALLRRSVLATSPHHLQIYSDCRTMSKRARSAKKIDPDFVDGEEFSDGEPEPLPKKKASPRKKPAPRTNRVAEPFVDELHWMIVPPSLIWRFVWAQLTMTWRERATCLTLPVSMLLQGLQYHTQYPDRSI